MELVQPGSLLPFEYAAFDLSPSLFVAMSIYDVTSGSPIFLTTTAMNHVVNGIYFGTFTPLADKAYLISKAVYTDGSFTTPNTSYPPQGESIFASSIVYECSLTAAIDPALDILDIQVWLNKNNTIVPSAQTAHVTLYNSLGNPLIILNSFSPDSQGVFNLTFPSASVTLMANQTYTAAITITDGSLTISSTRALQVF